MLWIGPHPGPERDAWLATTPEGVRVIERYQEVMQRILPTTQQAGENLMTYVGRPTPEQMAQNPARWAHSPSPPPPYRDPPSHYTDPPPPTQLFHIPPLRSLYNPAGEATPYFSLGMAGIGLFCIIAASYAIAINRQLVQDKKALEIRLQDYQKSEDDHAKEQKKSAAEGLRQAVENEFHLFPLESFKDLPQSPAKPAKESKPHYTPWPLELEEEGAESIQKIPS